MLGHPTMFCGQVLLSSTDLQQPSVHVSCALRGPAPAEPDAAGAIPLQLHVHGFPLSVTARKCTPAAFMQIGTDQFTDQLAQQLLASGCQLDLLKQVDGPTGTAVIVLQPNGTHLPLPVHVFCGLPESDATPASCMGPSPAEYEFWPQHLMAVMLLCLAKAGLASRQATDAREPLYHCSCLHW